MEMEEVEVDDRGRPTERARLWSSVIDLNVEHNREFWAIFYPATWVNDIDGEGK